MPHPFPGMNAWLERPDLWQDVHDSLITALRDALSPAVLPKYFIAVQERSLTAVDADNGGSEPVGKPELAVALFDEKTALPSLSSEAVAVVEPIVVTVPFEEETVDIYLEVYETKTLRLVTAIEILSPTNKRPGKRRREYEDKRELIMGSRTHFVEIDLLRDWEPMPFFGDGRDSHYRILVRRAERRDRADLYPFSVRDPIPVFRLPLLKGDPEPIVDVGSVLHALYDRVGYYLRVDYSKPPTPPLNEADAGWAAEQIAKSVPGAR